MTAVLHLGCGREKRSGAIGADINPHSDADVLCNLNARGYPFSDNCFSLVICEHVLEHLDDVVHAMEEIHRVGKPGARVLVTVPHFSSIFYYRDPTHKHPFSTHSFDYFVAGTPVRGFHYSCAEFRLCRVEFPPPDKAGAFKRAVYQIVNRHKDPYEQHFAFIFPRHNLEFELEIVKDADCR